MSDYKPYRVLQAIVAVVSDGDDTLICYPHGKVTSRMKATGKVGIVFDAGVINAPTEEEIKLFNTPALANSVKPIPQDRRGFDSRLSGVARSIEGSRRGREDSVIEKHERESAKAKAEAEKKPEPKIEAEPEITGTSRDKSSPKHAEPLIKNLEYLSPVAIKSLAEKNVLHIADLAEWTVDALNELSGIGTKLANRLLADHKAYLRTKEEGDKNE